MHRPSGKCGEREWSLARERLVPGTGTLVLRTVREARQP